MLASLDTSYWLEKFLSLCEAHQGPIPHSISVGPSSGTAASHFVVGAAVHGNEVGGIPAIVDFIENTDCTSLPSRITFFIGNYEAILANQRFVDYDLNRIILPSTQKSTEHVRAQELLSLLDTADYFLDLHQTIQPTKQAFYIFVEDEKTFEFARALQGSDICVLGAALPAGQMSTEQYVQSRGKPGLTLEIGHKGINQESFAIAHKALQRVAQLAADSEMKPALAALATLAKNSPPLRRIQIVHQCKFVHAGDHLLPGWTNLAPVHKGTELGQRASGEKILSPMDGFICFPKYPTRDAEGRVMLALPNHLFEIATELSPA